MCTFEGIVEANPNLRTIGIRALRSWGYTDDEAHQEILIALWEGSQMELQPKNAIGFAIRTVRNAEIDKARSTEAKATHVQIGVQHEPTAQAPFSLEWFFDLTKQLSHKKRRILYQVHILGYKYGELAEHYGVAEATIKTRIHRICKNWR